MAANNAEGTSGKGLQNDLETGDLALDVAKQSVVAVVDPDVGPVEEQDEAVQEVIRIADGNQLVGFTPSTRCAIVEYPSHSDNDNTYTMPITRIKTSAEFTTALRDLMSNMDPDVIGQIDVRLRENRPLESY